MTGNNLGQLAGIISPPDEASIAQVRNKKKVQKILASGKPLQKLHRYAQKMLAQEEVGLAAALVWLGESIQN